MKLSKVNFDLACQFIEEKARQLDRALFQYHFKQGSAEAVLSELSRYQNPDGGIGHGMEPDFRMAGSSPLATSLGLQYAVAVNPPLEHPIIVDAMHYLISTYNLEENYWPATFLDVNEEPHAPWWSLKEVCAPPEDDWPNPGAELAGYLFRFADLIPASFMTRIEERVFQNLEHGGGMTGRLKYYNFLNWQRVFPYFPPIIQELLLKRMHAAIPNLPLTAEEMMEVRISWLAPTPDSILAQELPTKVNELLNLEIAQQSTDGGWWPSWEWGQYPEVWRIVRQEWAGKITLEVLLALRAHGLIETF